MRVLIDAAYSAPMPVSIGAVPFPVGPGSSFFIPGLRPGGSGTFDGGFSSGLPQAVEGVKLQMLDPDELGQGNLVVLLEQVIPASYSFE